MGYLELLSKEYIRTVPTVYNKVTKEKVGVL